MIKVEDLEFVGSGLHRPECVLASADGCLHVADWRGGVTVIHPDGAQETVLAEGEFKPKANGIALLQDGSWLIAHLGEQDGGVYHLDPQGKLTPFLLEVEGQELPPTNFVQLDGQGRAWVTVSTRLAPRSRGYRPDCSDGFIVLADEEGARIVADGLGYTNECHIHPETGHLFVNETFARRLTRYEVSPGSELTNRQTIAEFGPGTFPDGLTFDAEGGIWITSIVSNRVIRVLEDGTQDVVLEDSDPAYLEYVEKAYLSHSMGREHLDRTAGRRLRNISSLAFGGEDRKTAYLGCLLGDKIATFRSTVAGLEPYHWHFARPDT
ncbi:MAG: SMP-30/gluconolactonase/LRE family protein [Kiloniellales bacterium]|nr:SMP-30/gluconolactonase/LRE family protein [Kiloniellales bacterium]